MLNSAPLVYCPFDGITVHSGIDTNLDHVLQLSEASSTQYVCNGSNGNNGMTAQVVITTEPAGVHCTQGGRLVSVVLDLNSNGILELAEVTTTDYICHGAPGLNGVAGGRGSDGTNGTNGTSAVNSLVEITVEKVGDNCSFGGSKVTSGIDKNGNNVLDQGSDEVTSTVYVCNGSTPTNPAYAYLYNLGEQRVAIDSAVQFDSNGLKLGVTYDNRTSEIGILVAGVYTIDFSIYASEKNQFELAVNGKAVPRSFYSSLTGAQWSNGRLTLALQVRDQIKVVNATSSPEVVIPSLVGENLLSVNASITIQKIDD